VLGWLIGEYGSGSWVQLKTPNGAGNFHYSVYWIYGSWTHYVWTISRDVNGTTIKGYRNGVLQGNSGLFAVYGSTDNANPVEIYQHNNPFNK
jgi:hypothetical protein